MASLFLWLSGTRGDGLGDTIVSLSHTPSGGCQATAALSWLLAWLGTDSCQQNSCPSLVSPFPEDKKPRGQALFLLLIFLFLCKFLLCCFRSHSGKDGPTPLENWLQNSTPRCRKTKIYSGGFSLNLKHCPNLLWATEIAAPATELCWL